MGKFYLGHVSYNGTHYYGWQKQKDLPTIQETVFDAIRTLYPLGRIDVKATSRTDRGVHAISQVVKFLAPRKEDPEDIREKLNQTLPSDIFFHDLSRINKSFKVTHLSLYKEYLYFFTPKRSPLNYPFVGHWQGTRELDIDKIRRGAKLFLGKKNFIFFQNRSDSKGGYEREILEVGVFNASDLFPEAFKKQEEIYCFHVKGKGFLKQMVRMMMGALFLYAEGELTEDIMELSLQGERPNQRINFIAPAAGLFLYHIAFPKVTVADIPRHVIDKKNWQLNDPGLTLWKKEGNSFPVKLVPTW